VRLLFEPHLPSTSLTCFFPCFFSSNIGISKFLLSQHSIHPYLSPRDLDQWYQRRHALHQDKGLKHVVGSNICSNHTSFWYYHNPFVGPYIVRIIVGPHKLHGIFFSLGSLFTIARRTIHRFTTSIHGSATSIGMEHFQQICRVSMLPIEVPQPLQQPMLL
jgi:hypothetical protein